MKLPPLVVSRHRMLFWFTVCFFFSKRPGKHFSLAHIFCILSDWLFLVFSIGIFVICFLQIQGGKSKVLAGGRDGLFRNLPFSGFGQTEACFCKISKISYQIAIYIIYIYLRVKIHGTDSKR